MRQMIGKYAAPANIMKKKYLLIKLLLLCILLSGCNSTLKYEKSQDEFGTNYKNEHIEVQIANNVENPEEIFKSIERDLNTIHDFEPIEKLNIHINEKFLKGNAKSAVECNAKFVNTPQFKQLLIADAYDLYDNWKAVGIYGNLFAKEMDANEVITNARSKTDEQNDNQKSDQTLNEQKQNQNQNKVDFASYYQNHDFSLFGAHFFPDFSSEEEIKNLSHASTNLVKYLIDSGKKEKLLKEEIAIEDIKPWAEQNNINLTYLEELYNHINEIKVSSPSAIEKLNIETKRDINGFSIRIITIDKQYDTATKLEQLIETFDDNIEKHRQLMKKKAPNFFKEFEKPLTELHKIEYHFNMKESANFFSLTGKYINLQKMSTQLHEYAHLMMNASFESYGTNINKPVWVAEGIDPYLDYYYHLYDAKDGMNSYIERNILDKEHFEQTKKTDPIRYNRLQAYGDVIRANFTEEELNDFDKIYHNEEKYKKLVHIKYAAALGHPEAYKLEGFMSNTVVAMRKKRDSYEGISAPDQQNYFANVSFFGYLVETYGYEKMLYFSVQDFSKTTFEEYFGKSYEELDADWKQYLIDNIKGGELLVYGEKGRP